MPGETKPAKMAGALTGRRSRKDMEKSMISAKDPWESEIYFSRFFSYPINVSTNPDLVASNTRSRTYRRSGTWISSSSPAFLQLVPNRATSDVILSVVLEKTILEEHYVSKLHFSWPQVSCVSGFPARGTRAIFVSYKDSDGQIQKFSFRFSTVYEAECFLDTLQEMAKDEVDVEPLCSEFNSQISSHSELISSIKPSYRTCEDMAITPVDVYIPQMPPNLKEDIGHHSFSQKSMSMPDAEAMFAGFPPSFTSLLSNCCQDIDQASQPSVSEDNDLKSQIVKYMEDSSFQEMLNRVEKVFNEIEGGLML